MKNLAQFTDKELQEELKKRKEEGTMPPPQYVEPDWRQVESLGEEVIKAVQQGNYNADAAAMCIYEAAMIAMYGQRFFTWQLKMSE